MLTKNKELKLNEIISYLRDKYLNLGEKNLYLDNNWCVYSKFDNINLDTICYIDKYPEVDDTNYKEKYSVFIENKGLHLVFRDELLQDVIISTLNRKKNSTNEELLQAILYFDKYDSFNHQSYPSDK